MIKIRYAKESDREFWFRLDKHMSQDLFEDKIRGSECYIALENEIPAGILRYNLFWDNTPFCNLLFIDEPYRKNGIGTELMRFWEEDMLLRGYDAVLTSTQSDEDAQHFYRKIGYKDIGALTIDDGAAELFFVKRAKDEKDKI